MLSLAEKKKRKNERRKQSILRNIKTGELTFERIASKFNISYQRVSQVALEFNITRKSDIMKNRKTMIDEIMVDISNGFSKSQILSKHGINENHLSLVLKEKKFDMHSWTKSFREKRDAKITSEYMAGKKAKDIIVNPDTVLDDPTRIMAEKSIYAIAAKNGFKRYPKIGNRSAGGCFEDKKIMSIIIKMRENKTNPIPYIDIAKKLNDLGYTTVQGVAFQPENIGMKYNKYLKDKEKNKK